MHLSPWVHFETGPEHPSLFLFLWDKPCLFKSLLQTRPKFASWCVPANAERPVASWCRYNTTLFRTCCWCPKPQLSRSHSVQSQVRLAQASFLAILLEEVPALCCPETSNPVSSTYWSVISITVAFAVKKQS